MANLEINMPDDLYERLRLVVGVDAGDGAVADFALTVIRREVEWLEKCMLLYRSEKTDCSQMRSLIEGTAPRLASPKAWPPGKPPGGQLPPTTPEAPTKQEKPAIRVDAAGRGAYNNV